MLSQNDTSKPSLALRPREGCQVTRSQRALLWDWTHNGDIPHVRIGRTILYPVDLLREWLSRRTEPGKGAENVPG